MLSVDGVRQDSTITWHWKGNGIERGTKVTDLSFVLQNSSGLPLPIKQLWPHLREVNCKYSQASSCSSERGQFVNRTCVGNRRLR